jgi:hypothetical protein
MWTARAHGGGGGPTPKKGIEYLERTTSASRLVRLPYGESGINVLFGRREHIDIIDGQTPKKGIMSASTSASRREDRES